jgi:hypothetical protein
MPPEILTLIPDFWYYRIDSELITLTHVCRNWREMFTSRSSLWTRVDCNNADKTRVFLERSKSSPINVSLSRSGRLPPDDPFFQIDHRAVKRLVSLHIDVTAETLQCITPRLFYPAPLLEQLGIYLTSFELAYTPPGEISAAQLLDFFESAPHLQEVMLHYVSPTSIDQDERLVSLAHLKYLDIFDDQPTSPLICHLLIPVGASLRTEIHSNSGVEGHLPRSLINLRNLLNFTQLSLYVRDLFCQIECIGPSGKVLMTSTSYSGGPTRLLLEFLDRFNTSTVKVLEIAIRDHFPQDLAYQLLFPMNSLRTLTISPCNTSCPFIQALNPDVNSESVLVCPSLGKLVLHTNGRVGISDIEITGAARELRGAKINSVQILEG